MNTVTATATFTGLSVLTLYRRRIEAGVQIGYCKDDHQPANMEIRKMDAAQTLVYTTRDIPEGLKIGMKIRINANQKEIPCRLYRQPGDQRDFNLFPNFEGPDFYNSKVNKNGHAKNHLSAIVNVHDAVLYTFKLGDSAAIRYDLETPPPINPRIIPQLGNVLGAELRNEDVLIEVATKDGNMVEVPLSRAEGPFHIHIWNCPKPMTSNHIQHLYHIVHPPNGTSYGVEFTRDQRDYWPFPGNQCDQTKIQLGKIACQGFFMGENDLETEEV